MLRLLAGGLILVLTSCSAEIPAPTESPAVQRRQQAHSPATEDLSLKADDDSYAYDPSGRRDPFVPLLAASKPTAAFTEEKLRCPPTQEFELASLKLVAIVWGDLGRKAMLKAPNGRGYAVTEEMLIGRNCGRIRRIDSNAVVIEETRHDTDGHVSTQEVVLRLREYEG